MAGRRILITGVANPLGARLAALLAADPEVDEVIGLDTREPPEHLGGKISYVEVDVRSPDLGPLLRNSALDTIVHNDIVQFPEPDRTARNLHDINVIGTLQLMSAADQLPTLRQIIVRGSAAIYGSEATAPLFWDEADAGKLPLRTRFQRDCAELEKLVETFARRHAHVTCTTLRLQPVVGLWGSPIDSIFTAPVVLTALGFDPRVQVLHADDAVAGLAAAVRNPVRGPVNLSAEGVVSMSRALRRTGRRTIPVAAPLLPTASAALARAGGARTPTDDVLRYMRHGRAVKTTRMREELRFTPAHTTLQAIESAAA